MAAGVKPFSAGARIIFTIALVGCGGALHAFEPITISGDFPLRLQWQAAPVDGRRPAIIALHGCGGLYGTRGELDGRYTSYAKRWNAMGWHVAAPDSFGSRGESSICTQPAAQRGVKVSQRRDDVLRTAAWLSTRADVDPRRIAVVGWSNGASTALEVLDRSRWQSHLPAAVVTYYPGCGAWKRRALVEPAAPLLMLLGEADEWTPAPPCQELGQRFQADYPGMVTVRVYADGHHGFDSRSPVRFRADIPAGTDKRGVHVGGNPAAREAALAELDRFLGQHLRDK